MRRKKPGEQQRMEELPAAEPEVRAAYLQQQQAPTPTGVAAAVAVAERMEEGGMDL